MLVGARSALLLDTLTRRLALLGFAGLTLVGLLTFYDGGARFLDLPRVAGFSDYGEVVYSIVIASCFPAVLLRSNNITIRFFGKLLDRYTSGTAGAWVEVFGSLATLSFFSVLGWQFIELVKDQFNSGRVTGTIEMPTGPWWSVTTAIMLLCIPVQLYVVAVRLTSAVTGRRAAIDELKSLDNAELEER